MSMPLAFLFDWWNELTLAKQIFYGLGLLAGLMTMILVVLMMFGLDSHHDMDGGDLTDAHGFGSGMLAVKPMTGFFLGFGWGGALGLEKGLSIPVATLCGLGLGAAIMIALMAMFRAAMSLRSDGTMQVNKTVGATGTVYLTLPPSRQAGGQVIVNFSGRQETFEALNASDQKVPSGDKVKVLAVIDSRTLLVEPLA